MFHLQIFVVGLDPKNSFIVISGSIEFKFLEALAV